MRTIPIAVALVLMPTVLACRHLNQPTEITAVPLSPWNCGEPLGIPYYLPKPMLVISKNFHYVEEQRIGETGPPPIPKVFDDQAKYADVNARTGPPGEPTASGEGGGANDGAAPESMADLRGPSSLPAGAVPADGLAPHTFFTFHILFVPDLTQKYGMTVRGGAGEMRAALNLVNGWQYTGLGPYYMKDSSTSQNILSSGIAANLALSGAGDVVKSVMDLRQSAATGAPSAAAFAAVNEQMRAAKVQSTKVDSTFKGTINDYAEIHVYEPRVDVNGMMQWVEITPQNMSFVRHFLGLKRTNEEQFMREMEKPLQNLFGGPSIPGALQAMEAQRSATSPASVVTPEVLRQTLERAIPVQEQPQSTPKNKGFFRRLMDHKKSRIETRQMSGVLSGASGQLPFSSPQNAAATPKEPEPEIQ